MDGYNPYPYNPNPNNPNPSNPYPPQYPPQNPQYPPPPPSSYPYNPTHPSLQPQHSFGLVPQTSFTYHADPPAPNYPSAPHPTYPNSGPYPTYPDSGPPLHPLLSRVHSETASPVHSPHSKPSTPFSPQFSSFSHNSQVVPAGSGNSSIKILLLHGNLDVWVHEARNLPNMDQFSSTFGGMFANTYNRTDQSSSKITSDPYVTFSVANATLARTFVISNCENPVWNQHFYVSVAHHAAEVRFMVKDSDVVGSQLMGTVVIPADQIHSGAKVEGTYPVLASNGKPCKAGAVLRLSIQYIPIETLSMYHQGVGSGPEYVGVPGTYFPLRKGGSVTLYQDAHVPEGCLPEVRMEHGVPYKHGQCWVDITHAISNARRMIYITGWSVYHKVELVRDGRGPVRTLGDLLKVKSQEGVRVLLLVWDDPTSRNILGYQRDGLMATHDEETRKFFKHSSVKVVLCPRVSGKRHGWVKQQEAGLIFTHHQKTVIVDADAAFGKRKIVAFVGGLDLCDGRYDNPTHPLFRTLQTLHKDDYHNPTLTGTGGPREPWHDLHTKIDGPAAYDVLKNFEQRWLKASKPRGMDTLKRTPEDSLLKIDRMPDIIGVDEYQHIDGNISEDWHVQVFRSIDSNSVKGFPNKQPRDASRQNLVCGKNILVDMSIHTAYVKAIRSAQHYIYIENQYFLGSSYNWNSYKDLGANNLIPMEIALKVASKIRANERFSVYIVIPMWPEGIPTDISIQRILYWQNKTMQMMYETIYKALVEVGLQDVYTPQDYLNFFCLGNREALDSSAPPVRKSSTPTTPIVLAQKSRRFMIYVHSKGMIVDDEYLIVGSANINQRSLEGTRDTEIAMGAYQPQHTWAVKRCGPRGHIYAYRMSLWAEHTGTIEECFNQPESLECMRRVLSMGEMNWNQFISNEVTEMRGHLLKYPVDVDKRGVVKPLAGCETFPDVGGNICGSSGTIIAIQENLTI